MPQFEDKKLTNEFRWVAHKVYYGPNPFDVRLEKRLEQKWKITRGGFGDGVKETEEWVPVPVVSEEKAYVRRKHPTSRYLHHSRRVRRVLCPSVDGKR